MLHEAVYRIGEVRSVVGRIVKIKVDTLKNSAYLLYNGELVKNVAVGTYLKITKGFSRLIAKVEGEYIEDDIHHKEGDKSSFVRILSVCIIGLFEEGKFTKGAKALPLVGDEAFLLSKVEYNALHDFCSSSDLSIYPGTLLEDEQHSVGLSVAKLFASHIGIFGNTGSGKSYTLAKLYNCLFAEVLERQNVTDSSHFILFDFNGEYSKEGVITTQKKVYRLSTHASENIDRLPMTVEDITSPDILSILSNATEKTQKPFLKRALNLMKQIKKSEDPESFCRALLKNQFSLLLRVAEKQKGELVQNYFEQIIKNCTGEWFASTMFWMKENCAFRSESGGPPIYPNNMPIENIDIYNHISEIQLFHDDDALLDVINFLYIQLIVDLLANRVVNEHIAPVIAKLRSAQTSFSRVFRILTRESHDNYIDLLSCNKLLCVIDLNRVNIEMRKIIPLLLSIKLYRDHKKTRERYLNLIIDEAHNILSYSSQRESETWKDYRLETFEEIIKEGRKFGVFLTIASQRPSDISSTIVSQLHNYFIHRLVNEHDLNMVSQSISYLDRVSHDMLPIMPTGSCVLAGLVTQMPVVLQIGPLKRETAPASDTVDLNKLWGVNLAR